MAELKVDGYTLGQKHQHYNTLVQDALNSNKTVDAKDFNIENGDIVNLLNIDTASHQTNVEYILKVFTCEDMLYVSRAIGQSNWLFSDQNYAHIINPTFLNTDIFPQMTTKSILKLKHHIRSNLNDEKRAEEFYASEENPKEAVKWLPYCSTEFIQAKITNHVQHLKTTLLRRLCEKSINVLEIYIKNNTVYNKQKALQSNMFLLTSNPDRYLDLVENLPSYQFPTFNKRATKFLMKNYSSRIINKFKIYCQNIHLQTFITYLKQENIKDFLLKLAQNLEQSHLHRCFNMKRLILFIKSMPQEIRFEFVKLVFIDKNHLDPKESFPDKERKGMNLLCASTCNQNRNSEYIWYQFAPYNVAFQKVTELLETATSNDQKRSLLCTLLDSAQDNLVHEHAFLEYLRDKKKNTENHVKEQVIEKLLSNYNFLKYEPSTWIVLDDIFKIMNIYTESEDHNETFIEAIILYKVCHDEKVPDIIEKKFNFNTLVKYHKKLNDKNKNKVFLYLYKLFIGTLTKIKTTSESEFKQKISKLELVLNLLKDFKKELEIYPDLISIIRDLIKNKNDFPKTVDITTLFNINKTWRKLFFQESLSVCPTEPALINALKHGPSLLDENKDVVHNILCDDKISLKHFLTKIKIFWANSIAKNMSITYTEKLNVLGNHKATTQGLSILLPRRQLQDLIKKYAPKEAKVDWDKISEVELSVQQQFAKNMHNARPQPIPETVLWFAKGDYLQYALPSLLAIFYNLNSISSRKYIASLLNAPVSLQKHGIRLAVSKLDVGLLLHSFSDIWKNNKNVSIRSVMFKNVHTLLCKENEPKRIQATWELVEMFIDNLTFQEDKAIYNLLFEVKNVVLDVRGRYYIKCYKFLKNLTNSGSDYEEYKQRLHTHFAGYSINIIDQLELIDPQFLPEVILEFVDKKFTKNDVDWRHRCIIDLFSSYLLHSTDEETQMEKYEKTLLPVLKQCFNLWSVEKSGKCFVRYYLTSLLNTLRRDMQNRCVDKKKIIPSKMFSHIQKELEQFLPVSENYILLTKWKLTVAFVKLLAAHEPILNWEEVSNKVAMEFGDNCVDYMRKDCEKYFPTIYLLFVKALRSMLRDCVSESAHWHIYRCLVHHEDFIQGYLATIKVLPTYTFMADSEKEEIIKLIKNINEHPSTEIRMHFYDKFQQTPNKIIEILIHQ